MKDLVQKSPTPPKDPPILSLLGIGLGIVLAWPWIALLVCDVAGICLAAGDHRTDGWSTGHVSPKANPLRLIMGITAVGAGIRGLTSR